MDNWLYKYQEQQLHFFWAFSVTTLAVFWKPLLISGLVVTVVAVFWKPLLISGLVVTVGKEIWDAQNPPHKFSWNDVKWGVIGWVVGLLIVGA